ncbi:MAG TPA: hypothetical protein VF294_15315 [Polyangiaceae bacterium]
MRAALAVFRVCAFAILACAACTATARGPLAGASDAWKNGPEPAPPAPPPRAAWDSYGEALHWPAANSAPFTSHGHQPEQEVDLRVNDVARTAYGALVTDTVFPDGSVLAELPHTSGGGMSYAMRKESGQWSYFQLDSQGSVLASGALSLCAGCHAQAPADRVFGPPRMP